ncbi:MAG: TonB-dependent receptor [Bacteroidales bacterium]|nr:TonB-dependent receptor [Bacteroidales bacterium]
MRKLYIPLLGIVMALNLYSQNSEPIDTSKVIKLEDVVVSASRWEEPIKNVPARVVGITAKDNAFQNQQTTADMISNTGQIFVQKSQLGGGSTVLRGFEASRVLLVIDGVRMNNAIYRGGHLQDIITIDQSMLEKTEVLFGPSSTLYGSDALGGVIHFYTKMPQLDKIGTGAFVRYSSANNEKTGHLEFNIGKKKWASLTSVTFSNFGDLHVGNNFDAKYGDWGKDLYYVTREGNRDSVHVNDKPNVMVGSGYMQYDLMEKLLFKQSNKISHVLNIQLSNNIGEVPRYDRLLQISGGKPKYAENGYGPQKRFFASYTLDLSNKNALYDDAKVILSTQDVDQIRIGRNLNKDIRTTNLDNVKIYALNADLTKKMSEKFNLYYGAEAVYNIVNSKAKETDIVTGVTTWNSDDASIETRFADGGSTWTSLALYAQGNYSLSEIISLTGGLRFSSISMTNKYNDATLYPVTTVTTNQMAPSGSLGLVANLESKTKLSVLGSTGFRSPNVEDMTSFTPAAGSTARVPNPDLKPEYAYNAEFNVSQVIGNAAKVEAGIYYTMLKNAMIVRDTKYNGSDSVEVNGILYKAQSIQNANFGNVYGWYFAAKWKLIDALFLDATLNATYGDYTLTQGASDGIGDTIVPMDHIPPMFGKFGLTYQKTKYQVEVFVRFSAAKKLEDYSPSGEDNLTQTPYLGDDADGNPIYEGTPSWYTLNFRAAYQINKHFGINAGVENILDTHYRQFASGISAPGRNIYLSLRANF